MDKLVIAPAQLNNSILRNSLSKNLAVIEE